jgi:hypothetical protein
MCVALVGANVAVRALWPHVAALVEVANGGRCAGVIVASVDGWIRAT